MSLCQAEPVTPKGFVACIAAWVLGARLDIDLPVGGLLSLSYRRQDGSKADSNGYGLSFTYRGQPERH